MRAGPDSLCCLLPPVAVCCCSSSCRPVCCLLSPFLFFVPSISAPHLLTSLSTALVGSGFFLLPSCLTYSIHLLAGFIALCCTTFLYDIFCRPSSPFPPCHFQFFFFFWFFSWFIVLVVCPLHFGLLLCSGVVGNRPCHTAYTWKKLSGTGGGNLIFVFIRLVCLSIFFFFFGWYRHIVSGLSLSSGANAAGHGWQAKAITGGQIVTLRVGMLFFFSGVVGLLGNGVQKRLGVELLLCMRCFLIDLPVLDRASGAFSAFGGLEVTFPPWRDWGTRAVCRSRPHDPPPAKHPPVMQAGKARCWKQLEDTGENGKKKKSSPALDIGFGWAWNGLGALDPCKLFFPPFLSFVFLLTFFRF